jgi:hypothetical protein
LFFTCVQFQGCITADGHRLSDDVLFALLARTYQFVFLTLQREEQVLVFEGQVLAVFEQGEDVLALVFGERGHKDSLQ